MASKLAAALVAVVATAGCRTTNRSSAEKSGDTATAALTDAAANPSAAPAATDPDAGSAAAEPSPGAGGPGADGAPAGAGSSATATAAARPSTSPTADATVPASASDPSATQAAADTGSAEILILRGAAAQVAYEATNLEATPTDSGTTKTLSGRLAVWCSRHDHQPGARLVTCAATVPLPVGAEGFPAPPFLDVSGDAAVSFYTALKVAESYQSGLYQKSFNSDDATYDCHTDGTDYACVISTGGRPSGIPPGAL